MKPGEVKFIFLNMYDTFDTGRVWAHDKGFAVPLYDSGYPTDNSGKRGRKAVLTTAGGKMVDYKARLVPHTFVLDRNGIVVSVSAVNYEWRNYDVVLQDVIEHSTPSNPVQ